MTQGLLSLTENAVGYLSNEKTGGSKENTRIAHNKARQSRVSASSDAFAVFGVDKLKKIILLALIKFKAVLENQMPRASIYCQ